MAKSLRVFIDLNWNNYSPHPYYRVFSLYSRFKTDVNMAGLYIHIPYCARKCSYCAFYSIVSPRPDFAALTEALLTELRLRRGNMRHPVYTIYIGGGTPSLMDCYSFRMLAEGIFEAVGIDRLSWNGEFTLETNPDDVSVEKADEWKNAGVNRVSMGVQSFDDAELHAIGRRHDARTAMEAYSILRRRFDNISLDLIFGLPDQSRMSWCQSIEKCISLQPEHISAYSLMYEERSLMTRQLREGKIRPVDEVDSEEMYCDLLRLTADAGYEHYEISNFARPGFRAMHNSAYWHGLPYIGIGPGASGYDGKAMRYTNYPDLSGYIKAMCQYSSKTILESIAEYEYLSPIELEEEFILTRLRTTEGIEIKMYDALFGAGACEDFLRRCARSADAGNLIIKDGRVRLSPEGLLISDEIMAGLMP